MFPRFRRREPEPATVKDLDKVGGKYRDLLEHRERILRAIIDMETPGANATVKRMAAKAREGLGIAGGEAR